MEYDPQRYTTHNDDAFYHFATIDSTNSWAKRNAEQLDPAKLTLITAYEQTGGRGRYKRRWHSPAGQNIYATFCFFLPTYNTEMGLLALVSGLAVAEVLQKLGFEAKLKWPNDVLISSRKVCGILCETTQTAHGIVFIAGIGVDINMPKEDLAHIDQPATSLLIESGRRYDVEEVTNLLHSAFKQHLALFLKEGFAPFAKTYKTNNAYSVGQQIIFHHFKEEWRGTFHAIEPDGSLSLKLPSGEIKTFAAGEICF